MTPFEGMTLSDVLAVLDAVERAGCRVWLEGGWAVDALVGRQLRAHRDLDLDVDVRQEAMAVEALHSLDYHVDGDFRPNRLELTAPGRTWQIGVNQLTLSLSSAVSPKELGLSEDARRLSLAVDRLMVRTP